jgi:hypothetical protein
MYIRVHVLHRLSTSKGPEMLPPLLPLHHRGFWAVSTGQKPSRIDGRGEAKKSLPVRFHPRIIPVRRWLGSRIPLPSMPFQISYGPENLPPISCGDVPAILRCDAAHSRARNISDLFVDKPGLLIKIEGVWSKMLRAQQSDRFSGDRDYVHLLPESALTNFAPASLFPGLG